MGRAEIVSIGELLAEFIAEETGARHARPGRYHGPFASGAPAIFIDQAALCGARTAMVGAVGTDGFGKLIVDRLTSHGVDTGAVCCAADRPTGVAFASYNEDGSRDFVFHIAGSAADGLEPAHPDLLGGGAVLHVSGSSLGNAAIRSVVMVAARSHVERGGLISLDPNVRKELFADHQADTALRELIGYADFLLPSAEDLELLYPGATADEALATMLSGHASVVAIKCGSNGVLASDGALTIRLDAHRMEAVDPTGAGDCFCGTLVARLIAGDALELAARRANAAGALAVTRRGPMEGNSDLTAIDRLLAAAPVAMDVAS